MEVSENAGYLSKRKRVINIKIFMENENLLYIRLFFGKCFGNESFLLERAAEDLLNLIFDAVKLIFFLFL